MDNESFESAVHAHCARFAECFARGDLTSLVDAYYAEDACMLAPAAPALTGRPAIREALAGLRASGFRSVVLEPLQLCGEGTLGYEIGRARLRAGEGSGAREQLARYLVVWRRTGDAWRAQCDMFAMDAI